MFNRRAPEASGGLFESGDDRLQKYALKELLRRKLR
jgi:hypothetical protein